MSESFGGRLRERREALAIALSTIAQRTKIKESLLEGLERDDLSYWPSGIFRRAYVRTYAEAIGLNADTVLREFLALHPEQRERFPADPVEAPEASGSRPQAPPTRLRYLLGSAFGGRRHPQSASPSPTGHATDASGFTDPVPAPAGSAPVPVSSSAARSETVGRSPEPTTVGAGPDLGSLAALCTAFGRIASLEDLERLLHEAATLLQATGIVVWIWDEANAELRPAVASGYSARVLARLPAVRRDADNATAQAFRSERPCGMSGALVAPIVTAAGCDGVLAMEFPDTCEPSTSEQAAAEIVAAFLALLIAQTSAVEGEAEGGFSTDRRASGATS